METNTLILIITVAFIIALLFIKKNNVEGYDVKLENSSLKACGDKCTKTYGCFGFAFNDKNNICYLSQKELIDKPVNAKYSADYDNTFSTCNKGKALTNPDNYISELMYKDNSVYVCKENLSDTQFVDRYDRYQIVNDKLDKIGNMKITDVPDVEYEMHEMDWNNPTIDENIVKKAKNMWAKSVDYVAGANKNVSAYSKMNSYYVGKDLYPSKCVADIDLDKCLSVCSNNKDCTGVEFNPNFTDSTGKQFANVCCPKTIIFDRMPRQPRFKNGTFYQKVSMKQSDLTYNDETKNKNIIIS